MKTAQQRAFAFARDVCATIEKTSSLQERYNSKETNVEYTGLFFCPLKTLKLYLHQTAGRRAGRVRLSKRPQKTAPPE